MPELPPLLQPDSLPADPLDDPADDPPQPELTFAERFVASVRLNNTATSLYDQLYTNIKAGAVGPEHKRTLLNADESPLDFVPDDLIDYADEFEGYTNVEDINAHTMRIRRELRARQKRARLGTWEGLGFDALSVLTSPEQLALLFVTGGTSVAPTAGARAAQIGGRLAATEAAVATGAEALFQSQQVERDALESAVNIAGSAIVAGTVGGVVGALSDPHKAVFARLTELDNAQQARPTIKVTQPDGRVVTEYADGAGPPTPPTSEELARLGFPEGNLDEFDELAGKGHAFFLPATRLLESENYATVEAAQQVLGVKLKGRPTTPPGIEREVQRINGAFFEARRKYRELYKQLRKRVGHTSAGGEINLREFGRRVMAAARRNDVDPDFNEVSEAARMWRDVVVNPATRRMQRAGLLPDELTVKTADSYAPRRYMTRVIHQRYDELLNLVANYFRQRGVGTEAEARQLAAATIQNIKGMPDGRVDYAQLPKIWKAKARVLDISDYEIEDFLDPDPESVYARWLNTYAPRLAVQEQFGDGSFVAKYTPLIRREAARLMEGASAARREQLEARLKRDLRDLQTLEDRLFGRDQIPADESSRLLNTTSRALRGMTVSTKLGGQMLSAWTDVGTLFQHQTFGPAVRAFLDRLVSLDWHKLARHELEAIGVGVDNFNSSRALASSFLSEYQGQGAFTGLDRLRSGWREAMYAPAEFAAQTLPRWIGHASGMNAWNAAMKRTAGIAAQTNIYEALARKAAGTASKADLHRLDVSGVTDELGDVILEQVGKHGTQGRLGSWMYHTRQWDESASSSAALVERIVLNEAEHAVPTPGVGTTFGWVNNEFARFIGQFQTFPMVAHAHVTQPALSTLRHGGARGRLQTTAALGVMLGLSALSLYTKAVIANRERDFLKQEPLDLTRQIVDYSGATGYLFTGLNIADALFQGAISDQLGTTPSPPSFALPPGVSTVTGAYDTAAAFANEGEVNAYQLARLVPGYTLPYIRFPLTRTVTPPRRRRGKKPELTTR